MFFWHHVAKSRIQIYLGKSFFCHKRWAGGGPSIYHTSIYIYIYCFLVISHTHSFKTLPQVCGGVHRGDTRTRIERELHLPCQNVKMLTSGEPPQKRHNLQNSKAPFISFQPLSFYLGGKDLLKLHRKHSRPFSRFNSNNIKCPLPPPLKSWHVFRQKTSRGAEFFRRIKSRSVNRVQFGGVRCRKKGAKWLSDSQTYFQVCLYLAMIFWEGWAAGWIESQQNPWNYQPISTLHVCFPNACHEQIFQNPMAHLRTQSYGREVTYIKKVVVRKKVTQKMSGFLLHRKPSAHSFFSKNISRNSSWITADGKKKIPLICDVKGTAALLATSIHSFFCCALSTLVRSKTSANVSKSIESQMVCRNATDKLSKLT